MTDTGPVTHNAVRLTIYPAIDLRSGSVVRLAQGDLARTSVYSDDPAATARRWQASGATWVHVVNLDGAFGEAAEANWLSLAKIASVGIKVQFGGGLRDIESVRRAMRLGVARAVIGTAAVENPSLVDSALDEFGPDRVAAGVDVRDGQVRVKGWAEESALTPMMLALRLKAQGIRSVIYTDVSRDGMSTGVNVWASVAVQRQAGLAVIASGGVASLEDVRQVRDSGLAGLIIGRALYEGRIALESALREATARASP